MTHAKLRLSQPIQDALGRLRSWLAAEPRFVSLDDDDIAFAMMAPEIVPIASVDLLGELRQAWQETHRRP
jgi:hypothetical protein